MIRSLITLALGVTLVLSLVYSSAIRHGHADVPIAEAAEDVSPCKRAIPRPDFVSRPSNRGRSILIPLTWTSPS